MSAPRIGVDGFNLALPTGTGVASYARSLATTLSAAGHPVDLLYGLGVTRKTRVDIRESLFIAKLVEPAPDPARPLPLKRRIKRMLTVPGHRDMVPVPVTGRVVARDFAERVPPFDRLFTYPALFDLAPRYYRRYGRFLKLRLPNPPAVMHWTYPLPLAVEGAANVYTLHDLVPLRLPAASTEDRVYYDRLIADVLRDAAHIVTVSDNSKADIATLFGTDPDRITNTYQTTDLTPATIPPRDELGGWLRQIFDLPIDGYFLFYGAIEPKKNVGRLIEAYLAADLQTPLVIVGRTAWRAEGELRLLSGGSGTTLPGAARIRRIDHLPRAMLSRLVAGARAVTFPSLYEGFGLPVLEAMTFGVPILTSATSSLPEIAGDAGMMVDPYDVAAIAQALATLDRDAELRERIGRAGVARAGMFSPARYADRLALAYGRALGSGRG